MRITKGLYSTILGGLYAEYAYRVAVYLILERKLSESARLREQEYVRHAWEDYDKFWRRAKREGKLPKRFMRLAPGPFDLG